MPGEAPSLSAHSSAVSLPSEAQQQLKRHIDGLGGYASEDVMKALGINGNHSHSKQKSPPSSSAPSRPNSTINEHVHFPTDSYTGPGHSISRPDSAAAMHGKLPSQNIGIWVFIDIQLYTLESNTYVVDFKCDGYQNVIWHDSSRDSRRSTQYGSNVTSPTTSRPTSGLGDIHAFPSGDKLHKTGSGGGYWKPVSKRYKNFEKETTSPYPYIDVASDLVAHLAS